MQAFRSRLHGLIIDSQSHFNGYEDKEVNICGWALSERKIRWLNVEPGSKANNTRQGPKTKAEKAAYLMKANEDPEEAQMLYTAVRLAQPRSSPRLF